MKTQAIINCLPQTGKPVRVYFTLILDDNSLVEAQVVDLEILYGNCLVTTNNVFIPRNNEPAALAVNAIYQDALYSDILYTNVVASDVLPDNFTRIVQKLPKGVFLAGTDSSTIVGQDMMARAKMFDDYYQQYFYVKNQVYSTEYSTGLEFQYGGTVGLLQDSVYPDLLFQLLAKLATVKLNSYDLELFLSQYIYYRIGIVSAVFIEDHQTNPNLYWILDSEENSILGETTILAPKTYSIIQNLEWYIYNSSKFSDEFKEEIINLIIRISRADVGNETFFLNEEAPNLTNFELIGASYSQDPRTMYNKCIEYIGQESYPLNIVAYIKREDLL